MHLRGHMIVTGVQGELHQIGALMAADVLANPPLRASAPPREIAPLLPRRRDWVLGAR
jgi:hypothetical protein